MKIIHLKLNIILIFIYFLFSTVWAQATSNYSTILIKVKGLVCEFCVYKLKKTLKNVSFIDQTQSEEERIDVNLKQGKIEIKRDINKPIPFLNLYQLTKKNGYNLNSLTLIVNGDFDLEKNELIDKNSQQIYQLIPSEIVLEKSIVDKNFQIELLGENIKKNKIIAKIVKII